ncbi:WbqC family protein [Paenibacillus sp. y28]|uniref:WbqC family protein n=1 Tax=Paenibacillus sp. y28 TaxID=3129110 RepID=UPI00301A70D9
MKCVIMQPTFLPWSGYFQLMARADVFLFLDDVQFDSRSWQQRNRIVLDGSERFLTVPVRTKNKRGQLLHEAQTDDSQPWRKSHRRTLLHAYGKHEFGSEIIPFVTNCIEGSDSSLAALNMAMIHGIRHRLGLDTPIYKSSEIPVQGRKSDYLLKLCHFVGADTYLSPPGARAYIEAEAVFQQSRVKVEYQAFTPAPYPQKHTPHYISHLSIVDVIANIGLDKTRSYIGLA